MVRAARTKKGNLSPVRSLGMATSVILGFIVSVCMSLIVITLLSVVNVLSDTLYIDKYLQYLMVAIHVLSIFVGSVYAAQRVQAKVLFTGMVVGVLYVLFTIGVGMTVSGETISLSLLAGKLLSGLAAGALGGVVGANLA